MKDGDIYEIQMYDKIKDGGRDYVWGVAKFNSYYNGYGFTLIKDYSHIKGLESYVVGFSVGRSPGEYRRNFKTIMKEALNETIKETT